MKQTMEFDFDKFIEGLKEMNSKHGYKSLGEDPGNEDVWTVKGYQDCLEEIINLFKECMGIDEKT